MDRKGTGQEGFCEFGWTDHNELSWMGLSGNGNGGKAQEMDVLRYGFSVLDRYFLKDHWQCLESRNRNSIIFSVFGCYLKKMAFSCGFDKFIYCFLWKKSIYYFPWLENYS
jgi:hypothetical protein